MCRLQCSAAKETDSDSDSDNNSSSSSSSSGSDSDSGSGRDVQRGRVRGERSGQDNSTPAAPIFDFAKGAATRPVKPRAELVSFLQRLGYGTSNMQFHWQVLGSLRCQSCR